MQCAHNLPGCKPEIDSAIHRHRVFARCGREHAHFGQPSQCGEKIVGAAARTGYSRQFADGTTGRILWLWTTT
jgi:hypothetical protein